MTGPSATVLPGGHSEWEPPDPFSNSEVKTLCADASVDFVDVKVGHCQALSLMNRPPSAKAGGGFLHVRYLPALDQPVALFTDRQARRAALIQIRAGNCGGRRLHRSVVQLD